LLDDLIRAALQEAARECLMPDAVDRQVWSRIIQGGKPKPGVEPGSGGISDG